VKPIGQPNERNETNGLTFTWEALPAQQSAPKEPESSDPAHEFDNAFATFITAYNSLSQEEKPEKIRKIIRTSSTRDTERLSEMIDLFTSEGLQQDIGSEVRAPFSSSHRSCTCQSCPHKQELVRIDDFYKDFLSSPLLANDLSLSTSINL